MATQITNNGASLKIKIGTQERNIMKSQIEEIAVIKTNIIKIDVGKGALNNVFITHTDVTVPLLATPELLKDAINDMLAPATGGASDCCVGAATEAKQVDEIAKLTILNDTVAQVRTIAASIDGKVFFQPTKVDDSNPMLVYKGFALAGALTDEPVWAIQRIQNDAEIYTYAWADGNKNFDNVWNNRASLIYI